DPAREQAVPDKTNEAENKGDGDELKHRLPGLLHCRTYVSNGGLPPSAPLVEDLRKLVNTRAIFRLRFETPINGFGEQDGQAAVFAHRLRPACELLVLSVLAGMKRLAASGRLEQHHAD